ncbi:hypothetical protein Q4S45_15440 [Massilia sp. R2A-15]|uniref:hypothetical protein n=1 Tax=Massilia sp. R2A-15 TaxID=3064278 RepID=UPI0027336E2A|nr:hypothetical protein [Massilia sp. R2A-15]WLI88124.1 hypothetical protein Q4S45_15440 [Massilia sp. R2A-15]
MQSNRKMAIISTIVGAACSVVGIVAGFYIGVLKPLIATGAWKRIGIDKFVISALLIVLVGVGIGRLAQRALRQRKHSDHEQDAW